MEIKEQSEERPNLILMFHSGLFRFTRFTIGEKNSHLPATFFFFSLPELSNFFFVKDKLSSVSDLMELRSVPYLLSRSSCRGSESDERPGPTRFNTT